MVTDVNGGEVTWGEGHFPEGPVVLRPDIPAPQPLPQVKPTLERVQADETAKLVDQMGAGIRAMLGMGAMSLLPDLIADLRTSRDPDTRLKFVQMALKEGGYGTKDNKNDNLPTFHFTFNGVPGSVSVSGVPMAERVDEATPARMALQARVDRLSLLAGDINDEVAPAETPEYVNFFDQIVV